MFARSLVALRAGARRSMSTAVEFELRTPFATHLLEGKTGNAKVTATKEELMSFFEQMYTIRRMEIACDTEYKATTIRGFCHLSDGQEAIATGLQAALKADDDIVSSYRCHGLMLARGDSVKRIVGELFGFSLGSSKGKGGSMHFYSKKNHFWGGHGIVGAQVPVGVGLAFANKYRAKAAWPNVNVSVSMYGDGAANQGQIWEAANMAKLWKLPAILLCENNQYGMGTSIARHSSNPDYYKAGGVAIPGIQADGMDVLAVIDAVRFAREYASSGKGPLFMELKTYRYHGHSMSDPGLTYRDRDEVAKMRASRDCIDQIKGRIIEAGWSTDAELKAFEKDIRAKVSAEVEEARKGQFPEPSALYEDIFAFGEKPKYIRAQEFHLSKYF